MKRLYHLKEVCIAIHLKSGAISESDPPQAKTYPRLHSAKSAIFNS